MRYVARGEEDLNDFDEFLRTGEPDTVRDAFSVSAVRCKSSSEFLRLPPPDVFSTEFDREVGLVYRLEVDFDLVSPPPDLPLYRLPPPPPATPSNSFLVSLTVSGAGSSFSLIPNKTPAEGLFWVGFFAFEGCFGLDTPALVTPDGFGCGGSKGGASFSAIIMLSFTRAGVLFNTACTGGTSGFSLGGKGGGLSDGGGLDGSKNVSGSTDSRFCGISDKTERTSTDCARFIDSFLLLALAATALCVDPVLVGRGTECLLNCDTMV